MRVDAVNCPRCGRALVLRGHGDHPVWNCGAHGVWIERETLARLARDQQSDESDALLEGFIWGRLL